MSKAKARNNSKTKDNGGGDKAKAGVGFAPGPAAGETAAATKPAVSVPSAVPERGVGGYPAGAAITVPEGCVALVLPVITENMDQHVPMHVNMSKMSADERAAMKALRDGLDSGHHRLPGSGDHPGPVVSKFSEVMRFIVGAVASACDAGDAFAEARAKARP